MQTYDDCFAKTHLPPVLLYKTCQLPREAGDFLFTLCKEGAQIMFKCRDGLLVRFCLSLINSVEI